MKEFSCRELQVLPKIVSTDCITSSGSSIIIGEDKRPGFFSFCFFAGERLLKTPQTHLFANFTAFKIA